MLNSIWHLRGDVPLTVAATNAEIMIQLQSLLAGQNKVISADGPTFLEFGEPFRLSFGPSNRGLAMALYNRGRIDIEVTPTGTRLRYDLSCLPVFVFCVVASAIFGFLGFRDHGPTQGLTFAIVALAWLYGFNLILARVRVPRAIQKRVEMV